ncbi:MAG: arginase [Bacteroidetes bacterium]|nr:MAG: arginase [Bacteroidota bacterium]REK03509.1 MAG: arginase [Bacteroidota bacterium]REK34814.1 MAG: arginase [Bacteroidota bacterium]REK51306.1 MAG: arginase [Bacteroidota bacterium]
MDISLYFRHLDPVRFDIYQDQKNLLGYKINRFLKPEEFPDFSNCNIAIVGVEEDRGSVRNDGCESAPDRIREKLYELRASGHPYKIVDLGNIIPGATVQDTYVALSTIMIELLKSGVFVIVLGGSQDLTFAQYLAYQKLEETVNIVAVDNKFDLGTTDVPLNSNSYLGKIVLHEPNFLFNYSNVGYQTYFVGTEQVELMEKLYFDSYRLGQVQRNMEEAEPIVRNADILSFDISSIRQSDAPGTGNPSPNGFYGEEACQIVRYAGMSDKLSSFGLYELNPLFDNHDQTSHLAAQMLWYLIDGYYNRKSDVPLKSKAGFIKYHVTLKKDGQEIVFYKSSRSERWWMEVPYPNNKSRYQRHHMIPCSYKDYEVACNDDMPERWWQAFQKLN